MSGSGVQGSNNPPSITSPEEVLRRSSTDIGWDYCTLVDPKNMDKVKCKLCGKVCSGGIYRIKQHIGHIKGNVAACPRSSKEDQQKCVEAIEHAKAKKMGKRLQEQAIRDEIQIGDDDEEDEGEEEALLTGRIKKKPRFLGSMDKYVSGINTSEGSVKKTRQQNINAVLFKERTEAVHQHFARWVYESGIPFNAVDNDSFRRFVEAVGQFGSGYQPPSQYLLREPLLKKEVERTKESLKQHKEEWKATGCSIMTDAWTDRKRRSIMNLCVNSPAGTTFLSSKEASADAHTGEFIFQYVDTCIEEVGASNVVQVVTDNASNNMAAATLLKEKRPEIFWTSCASHTLDLMLEGIARLPKFKGVIEKAKAFTVFIYSHHKTLAMMRKATKKRDIVRPGTTRFPTAFLTLQSLFEKRQQLRELVICTAWEASKLCKTTKGKKAFSTVMSGAFWNGVSLCLKVFAPLVKLLRITDGDKKPSMGFVYGELLKAKADIKEVFNNNETNFRPILDVIDAKASGRLDSPLHTAAYVLNPYYAYKNRDIFKDPIITNGVMECVEAFFPSSIDIQIKIINDEFDKYQSKHGAFGRVVALKGCEENVDTYKPASWWSFFGGGTPNLQVMAQKILSLTSSSSGCERNWSTFEGIHTKKRNRLDAERLNNLVYVQFNARMLNKSSRRERDVLLDKEGTHGQEWTVEGDDDAEIEPGLTWDMVAEASGADTYLQSRRSSRSAGVSENPAEEHVDSDDDTEDGGDEEEVECESDDPDLELDYEDVGMDTDT